MVALLLWGGAFAQALTNSASASFETLPSPVLGLLGLAAGLASFATCVITCMARRAVRQRYGISEDGIFSECACGCEDWCAPVPVRGSDLCLTLLRSPCGSCCAAWCPLLTQCLLLRQEGLSGGRYGVCSAVGELPMV